MSSKFLNKHTSCLLPFQFLFSFSALRLQPHTKLRLHGLYGSSTMIVGSTGRWRSVALKIAIEQPTQLLRCTRAANQQRTTPFAPLYLLQLKEKRFSLFPQKSRQSPPTSADSLPLVGNVSLLVLVLGESIPCFRDLEIDVVNSKKCRN